MAVTTRSQRAKELKATVSEPTSEPKKKSKNGSRYRSILIALLIARVVATVVPQHGYIQPDEFFQFTEPIAGRILDVDVYLPWEFTRSQPLRSIFFPSLIAGSSFTLIKAVSNWIGWTPSPLVLLCLPRLLMALLSFIIDACLWSLCKSARRSADERLLTSITFASSYVAFTYLTHTFSNSIEAILLSLLLKLVIAHEEKPSARGASLIGLVLALGFFNRPTFPCFALAPLLYLIKRVLIDTTRVIRTIVTVSVSFTVAALALIAVDTLYYSDKLLPLVIAGGGGVSWDKLLQEVVLTPLNFFAYNTDANNLKNHGLHPFYFHPLISIPVVCLTLSWYLYGDIVTSLFKLITGGIRLGPKWFSVNNLHLLTATTPVVVLSFIPHAEPRFIMPVLVPITALYGYKIVSSGGNRWLWLVLNTGLFFTYGFVHQAGITRSLVQLHRDIRIPGNFEHQHIIWSRSYLPPRHLLHIDRPQMAARVTFHDLSIQEFAAPVGDTLRHLKNLTEERHLIHLIVPSCYSPSEIEPLLHEAGYRHYRLAHHFYPNFNAEDLECSLRSYSKDKSLMTAFGTNVWRIFS